MSKLDTRQLPRDSLFLMADIRAEGQSATHRMMFRNLSSGGMMVEGDAGLKHGALVKVTLRNVGEIDGTVAWVQDSRCGVAFVEEIDPKQVRAPVSSTDVSTPRFVRPPLAKDDDEPRGRVHKI